MPMAPSFLLTGFGLANFDLGSTKSMFQAFRTINCFIISVQVAIRTRAVLRIYKKSLEPQKHGFFLTFWAFSYRTEKRIPRQVKFLQNAHVFSSSQCFDQLNAATYSENSPKVPDRSASEQTIACTCPQRVRIYCP